MRVAVYTRASTDEAHQPYSLDAQTARLDAYISSQPDWQRVATFSDRISGATLDRPALSKALTAARAGRFDLLLVYLPQCEPRHVHRAADRDAGVVTRPGTMPPVRSQRPRAAAVTAQGWYSTGLPASP